MIQTHAAKMTDSLLKVEGLKTVFDTPRGLVRAVDTIDLKIRRGETFGVVGESGSGKTVMALSLMRLIRPPGRMTWGRLPQTLRPYAERRSDGADAGRLHL